MTDQKKAGWIPVEPDTRCYTNCFECPECGMYVNVGTFVTACDYDYCPYCGSRIEDGEQKEIMTTLVLPIKKQWFDMIRNHKKLEEYREIKPYWTKRFLKIGLITSDEPNHIVTTMNKALVTFRNGYGKDAPSFRAWVHMDIGRGMVSWGAIPGKLYYTLIIDKVVET